MTNYITSVGVQNFSIAITAGNASQTLSIPTVGPGAFLHFGGCTNDGSGDPDRQFGKLVLTSTSVITASKNGTTGACTITGAIIDGDTTNLIKSVQSGTIAKASGSATGIASISAVTDANTAVHSLGVTSGDTSANTNRIVSRFSLATTTVTQTVATSGDAVTGSFQVTEYQSGALTANAVQRISAASPSSVTSWTATIPNSVTTATAYSTYGGYTTASAVLTDAVQWFRGSLTSGTVFTISANTGEAVAKTYLASIVDTAPGVLNSNIQRGTTTLSAATSGTTPISPSVTYANAAGIYLGYTSTSTGFESPTAFANVQLTSGSLMATKLSSAGTATSSWEMSEYPAVSAANSTVTETVTESDSVIITATDLAALTETVTESYSNTIIATDSMAFAETITETDSYGSVYYWTNTLSETQTESDSTVILATDSGFDSESNTSSDVIAGAATGLTNLNEIGNVTDTHQGIASGMGLFTENNTALDAYNSSQTQPGQNTVTETVTESDSLTIAATDFAVISELVAANDNYDCQQTSIQTSPLPPQAGPGDDNRRQKYLDWLRRQKKKRKPTKLEKNQNRYAEKVIPIPKPEIKTEIKQEYRPSEQAARAVAIDTILALLPIPLSSVVNEAPYYELLELINELREEEDEETFMMLM